jgi:hypothetical protein
MNENRSEQDGRVRLGDVVFWVRSIGPGNVKDRVPMYYLGRLLQHSNEGERGDVRGRPIFLGMPSF